jgi:hypothetical protein
MSYAVTGASSIAATDVNSASNAGTSSIRSTNVYLETGLTAGTNTFTAKYRVALGTGTFVSRQLTVMPLP